ncbi:GNAT family N-acetyltransferase [Lacinutrix chionoecetis]
MKLIDCPDLETQRLQLNIANLSDVDVVFALRSNAIVRKYIDKPLCKSKAEALAHINKVLKLTEADEGILWILTHKETNTKIGSICFWNFSEDKKTAEVGYDLLPEYFKKGLMTEALKAVTNFGFKELKLETIEAFTHNENESSKKLLTSNGFVLQPHRKDPEFSKNRIYTLQQ